MAHYLKPNSDQRRILCSQVHTIQSILHSDFGEGLTLLDDREGLLASGAKDIDVLNDIAWDRDGVRIFGKAAQEIGQRFRETILALGGGKA
nr:glutaminyl-peptide cyclotransferase-like isoform X1 [Ipomoea batatas]